MKKSIKRSDARIAASLLFLFGFCGGCDRAAPGPPACTTCAAAKLANQWCDSCKVGYVAGVPIHSKLLFDALDAHGHELVLASITCGDCQAAIPREGFCEKCRIGWVDKKAYFSRLTYHLAKGRAVESDRISCPVCRKNAASYGWCDSCKRGMVGNVAISDRADFVGACRGYDIMMASIAALPRCELCALAILADKRCFYCRTWYKDGKPVKHEGN